MSIQTLPAAQGCPTITFQSPGHKVCSLIVPSHGAPIKKDEGMQSVRRNCTHYLGTQYMIERLYNSYQIGGRNDDSDEGRVEENHELGVKAAKLSEWWVHIQRFSDCLIALLSY